MTLDFTPYRSLFAQIRDDGGTFFKRAMHLDDDERPYWEIEPDHFWSQLDDDLKSQSADLQSQILKAIKPIANSLKYSALVTDVDHRDLGTWTKSTRASLRLRLYEFSEPEVLHDEGEVLGFQPASQSDTTPVHPKIALRNYQRDIENILGLVELLDVSPTFVTEEWRANPQSTTSYEPNSAFVMMAIDRDDPGLEDTYNTIRDCFGDFSIAAVRADEIEHEGRITDKVRERINKSEFLMADLTNEKPNVYYEVGYAHALDKRVILYRKRGTKLHFDLSEYNCPEYDNMTGLKEMLTRRLKDLTNRNP